MAAIRLFTDEDVYGAIAVALRRTKIDVSSTPEVGRRGQPDESQLEWASTEGRVFFTFNVAHFAQLHTTWLRQGRRHAGIVVSSQRPIGDVVRRLPHLSSELDAESMCNRPEFLGDW
jgi:hypothetical protein